LAISRFYKLEVADAKSICDRS
jgi:hypothetical protein